MEKEIKIKTLDAGGNIDIQMIAAKLQLPIATKWEMPLILNYNQKDVHIYQFGSFVFFNFLDKEIKEFINYLEKLLEIEIKTKFEDELTINIVEDIDKNFYMDNNNEILFIKKEIISSEIYALISLSISQSVALERYEQLSDDLEEDIEKIINKYNKYKHFLPIMRNVAIGKALNLIKTRHEIISDIMILDKPSITWEWNVYDELYEILARFFELTRRYKILSHKLDSALESYTVLNEINEGARANFLEFLIVVLIVFEIIMAFFHI
ncbi:RMD1 family protein [Marinitoga aeolica]|uniref:RMD1 family protein n=1 Tax=Marinitoga aeolica TaxID=2809031 RepID=A0ABY8PNN8_9BACT|nr:RMD1 family protein [Marinitoga aeolica]WGS64194.1 RMD1 family protein [Marinitoga aeolica]